MTVTSERPSGVFAPGRVSQKGSASELFRLAGNSATKVRLASDKYGSSIKGKALLEAGLDRSIPKRFLLLFLDQASPDCAAPGEADAVDTRNAAFNSSANATFAILPEQIFADNRVAIEQCQD